MTDLRPIRFYDNAVFIPLTQGFVTVVDAEDAFLVADRDWYARATRGTVYAVTNSYTRADGTRGSIPLHRVIMGDPDGLLIDHWDGFGLNNRRYNLRPATHAENARNKPAHRNNRSGVKGVHWNARDKRWVASIMHNGERHCLGSFAQTEIEQAASAYRAASIELHGAFAWSDPELRSLLEAAE